MQRLGPFVLLLALLPSGIACGTSPRAMNDLGMWTPGSAPTMTGASPTAASSSSSSSSGSSGSSSSGADVGSSSGGSSSSSSSSGSSASSSGPVPSGASLPCDVQTVLAAKCTACHSDPPINNSLAGLVTYSDLMASAKEDPTKNEAELSVARMQNTMLPMPPAALNSPPTAADIATLQGWISAGYPSGACDTDGGSGAETGPGVSVVDVFAGQPPFAAGIGRPTHNAGRNCLQCHSGNGGDDAGPFLFGGTLYDAAGNPVVGAEVRVVDAKGVSYSVFTGPTGTFYKGGGPLAAPAHTGVRDATHKALMISPVTVGGCSSCHCSGPGCTTTAIHLP